VEKIELTGLSVALQPNAGHGILLLEVSTLHITTKYSR